MLPEVKAWMRGDAWNQQKSIPWESVKQVWKGYWANDMPVLLEKSPPNLLRAFKIQDHFQPAYFVAMIRNPYAFCEGQARRHRNSDVRKSAKFWVTCARFQLKNIRELERLTWFTYEEMTQRPQSVMKNVSHLLPELHDLGVDIDVSPRNSMGRIVSGVPTNLNSSKIASLGNRRISEINSILEKYPELMEFFGYEYIKPSLGHSVHHIASSLQSYGKKVKRHLGTRRDALGTRTK
jgi:hypothetical protein